METMPGRHAIQLPVTTVIHEWLFRTIKVWDTKAAFDVCIDDTSCLLNTLVSSINSVPPAYVMDNVL